MISLPIERLANAMSNRVERAEESDAVASDESGTTESRGVSDDWPRWPRLADGLLRGMQGGLIATLTMTVFRLPTMRALPPTANFWSTHVGGGDPEDHPIAGIGFHLLYGVGAGGAFGVLFAAMDAERGMEPEPRGLLWGTVYGLVLSTFGTHVALKRLLGVRLDGDELAIFHAGHVVYGLSLGAWVGSRLGVPAEHVGSEYDYEPTDDSHREK